MKKIIQTLLGLGFVCVGCLPLFSLAYTPTAVDQLLINKVVDVVQQKIAENPADKQKYIGLFTMLAEKYEKEKPRFGYVLKEVKNQLNPSLFQPSIRNNNTYSVFHNVLKFDKPVYLYDQWKDKSTHDFHVFVDGLAIAEHPHMWDFMNDYSTYSIINKKGYKISDFLIKWVIPNYATGPIPVRVDEWRNWLDTSGDLLSKQSFLQVSPFENGYATVKKNKWLCAIVSDQWEELLQIENCYTIGWLSNGWATITTGQITDGWVKQAKDNFISIDGSYLLPQDEAKYVEGFENWYAFYQDAEYKDYRIDVEGNSFVAPRGEMYSEGYIPVITKHGLSSHKWNFFSKDGKLFSQDIEATNIGPFYSGWAVVLNWVAANYIKSNGYMMFEQPVHDAKKFTEGLWIVTILWTCHYVQPNGEFLTADWFDKCNIFNQWYAWVKKWNKRNVIDRNGNEIFTEYLDVYDMGLYSDGTIIVYRKYNGEFQGNYLLIE